MLARKNYIFLDLTTKRPGLNNIFGTEKLKDLASFRMLSRKNNILGPNK